MLFSVIICRIWFFATAINKLLFDKNCHICNSYQKGAIFYQSHKVFYTTVKNIGFSKQQWYIFPIISCSLQLYTESITSPPIIFNAVVLLLAMISVIVPSS